MDDITIVGAGPAGLTAAINLAKQGYTVTVYEKSDQCGRRFHGDFQGLENWSSPRDILSELQDMNIALDFWYKPVLQSEFFDAWLNKRTVRFEKPALYLIKRGPVPGSLDAALQQQAVDSGVTIHFNRRASPQEGDIIALGPRRADGIVRGMTFETTVELDPIIILDDRLAPKSFAYLLTGDGRGCLGTGLIKNYDQAHTYFYRTRKTFENMLDLTSTNERMFTGYFNFFLMKTYERQGKRYVGECAGLQDLLFAFGLRQAMTSGFLAARSILHDLSYDTLIKERFQGQLRTSMANRFLFNLMGNRGYRAFLNRGRKVTNPVARMYRQYNPTVAKRVVLPLAKLAMRV